MYQYKEHRNLYPVALGEVWRIGGFRGLCGDLLDEGIEELGRRLGLGGQRMLMYVDPPWSQGNMSSFYTKAGMAHRKSWAQLIQTLCAIGQRYCDEIWMEMGQQNVEQVAEWLGQMGEVARYPITYYRKYPAWLLQVGVSAPTQRIAYGRPLDDENTPAHVLMLRRPEAVVDPCMGRGLTALSAAQLGIACYGVELNPMRFGIALEKLSEGGLVACREDS